MLKPKPEAESKTRFKPDYHVILLNDDFHSFDYVVKMLHTLFRHPIEKCQELAKITHEKGEAIVFTCQLELAELKQEQIQNHGPDTKVIKCKGSMSARIMPSA